MSRICILLCYVVMAAMAYITAVGLIGSTGIVLASNAGTGCDADECADCINYCCTINTDSCNGDDCECLFYDPAFPGECSGRC